MNPIEDLLSELRLLGVELWVDGERLRYNAPRGVLNDELLDRIREHRRAIRSKLRSHRATTASPLPLPAITRVDRDGALPLTMAQQGFWSLEQLLPHNSFANVFSAFRLRGRLDVAALIQSFDATVRRHETLRTTFASIEGQPRQIIGSAFPTALVVEDLRGRAAATLEVACSGRIVQEAQRPFDLVQGPLFRLGLLQLGDEDHLLLLTMHHIISDTWSLQVLILEVTAQYEAFAARRPSPLPELAIQYADYAAWQRRLLEGGALAPQAAYWKAQLGGDDLSATSLPTDYPRPATQSFRTSCELVTVPRASTDALKSAGQEVACTLFMTLVAAVEIMLHGWTGHEDLRVGSLVATRNQRSIEGLIGLFLNTVLLRVDLSGDPTIQDVLRRVRRTVLEAHDNQDLPFEALVQALEGECVLERSSLCRVMVLFKGSAPAPQELVGLTLESLDIDKEMIDAGVEIDRTATTFDLIFTLGESPHGLTASLTYKTELFSPETIKRVLRYFQAVVQHIVAHRTLRLSKLSPWSGIDSEA